MRLLGCDLPAPGRFGGSSCSTVSPRLVRRCPSKECNVKSITRGCTSTWALAWCASSRSRSMALSSPHTVHCRSSGILMDSTSLSASAVLQVEELLAWVFAATMNVSGVVCPAVSPCLMGIRFGSSYEFVFPCSRMSFFHTREPRSPQKPTKQSRA